MPQVIYCAHCYRMFVPESIVRNCPECTEAIARIETECERSINPAIARATVAKALARLHEREEARNG